jgi:predicted enzyme related to lactoylglutathione lyase
MSEPRSETLPALQISEIGQIAVNVQDLERAVAFYRDVLGMHHLFTAGSMAFFDCGGVRLMLGLPDREEMDHPSSILYYRAADLEAAHQALTERGVECEAGPLRAHRAADHELWLAFFHDTEGNLFALMSEVPVSGTVTEPDGPAPS